MQSNNVLNLHRKKRDIRGDNTFSLELHQNAEAQTQYVCSASLLYYYPCNETVLMHITPVWTVPVADISQPLALQAITHI
jgi:hypothetical protein